MAFREGNEKEGLRAPQNPFQGFFLKDYGDYFNSEMISCFPYLFLMLCTTEKTTEPIMRRMAPRIKKKPA
jgi:hypothetical protein